jgi:hypothetical protein
VENQEDISSESMDSGIKHGNSKFSQQNQPQHTHGVESNEEVQNMLNVLVGETTGGGFETL